MLAYASKYDDKEIIDAVLTCKKCDREYKVIRGVPRFVDLAKIDEDKAAMAEYGSSDSGASLGDILGAALQKKGKKDE